MWSYLNKFPSMLYRVISTNSKNRLIFSKSVLRGNSSNGFNYSYFVELKVRWGGSSKVKFLREGVQFVFLKYFSLPNSYANRGIFLYDATR